MIVTKQPWDYAISTSSTPYELDSSNSDSPYTGGGVLVLPHPTLRSGVVNAAYINPYGSNPGRATYFELDVANADSSLFIARLTANPYYPPAHFPAIYAYGSGYMVLGWARDDCSSITNSSTYRIVSTSGTSDFDGDFTGRYVLIESGKIQVQLVRRMYSDYNTGLMVGTQFQIMMPSGIIYRTGWFNFTYDSNVISFNCSPYNYSGSGYFTVGTVTDIQDITENETEALLLAGPISSVPSPVILPYPDAAACAGGSNISMTTLSQDTTGYTLRYTMDGSTPTSTSPAYTTAIDVGPLFNPGSTTIVSAAYVNDSTADVGRIVTASYAWALQPPAPDNMSFYDGMGAHNNVTISWGNAPSSSAVEIVYTTDGSDPTTSSTAQVWHLGSLYLFNSNPTSLTPASYQQNILMAAMKYIPTGAYSTVFTMSIYFMFNRVLISTPGGAYTDDIVGSVSVSPAIPGLVYSITKDGVTTTSSSFTFTFGAGTHTVSASVATADGSLIGTANDNNGNQAPTYSFYQAVPVFTSPNPVTSTSTDVAVINLNGGSSVLHYTLDGSTPTATSPSTTTGFIHATAGSTVKVIAVRAGVSSGIAVTSVLVEYEVTEAATTIEGATNYHYYVSNQRLALTSQFGPSADTVNVGTNVTPDPVSTTVNGVSTSLSIWDHTNPSGAYNGFTEWVWFAVPTRFWSRLSYQTVVSTFSWVYNAALFQNAQTVTLFSFNVVSRFYSVNFRYVLNTATGATSIVRSLTTFGGTTSAETTISGAVLTDGGTKNIVINVGSTSVSFSDGTGTATETNSGFGSGALWSIEGVVNPNSVSNSYSNSGYQYADLYGQGINCVITTTATSGTLRRTPGSLTCSTSTISRTETHVLDFRDDQTQYKVRHGLYTYNASDNMVYEAPATFGYNPRTGITQIDGAFALAFPGKLDVSQDFHAEADLTTDFHAIMTNPSQCVGVTTLPSIALYLEPAGSVLNEQTTASAAGIVCRMFVPSSYVGAAAVHLELYAEGASPVSTRIALSSNTRRLHLKLTGSSAGIAASAIIDGVETVVATLPALTGNYEVRLRRQGSTYQPRIQTTELITYDVTGTFVKTSCTSPVLTGADFVYHGSTSGFPSTPLVVAANTVQAVYFNPSTNALTVENLAYEATGGRLLVGVIETGDDNILWTNLLYARLLKVRQESSGTPTVGAVLAVGSHIYVQDHRIHWTEAGIERSAAVGDFSWNTPYNHHDLRLGKQIVRALEYQTVKLTGSKVA